MTQQERDLACLLRLRAGDQRALEELYDRYSPLLYPLALRIVQAPTEAEDVVQEAWLQIWRRAGTYDALRGTVAAWIVTVARTRALDAYRARASRERAATRARADRPAEVAAAPPAGEQGLLRERVRSALGALPEREREVLETAYFEGLSQSEIAERLNAPLGTVKSWTRQGLRRLREILPDEEWT
jgi:RNA polymerase sigma-70 factor (ECF subfamily)